MAAYLSRSYLGNSLASYLTAALVWLAGTVVVWIIKTYVLKRAEIWAARTKTRMDDLLVSLVRKNLIPLLYYGALYLALQGLSLNPSISKAITVVGQFLVMVIAVRFALEGIRYGIFEVWIKDRKDDSSIERNARALMPVISVLAWSLGAVFLLDNLGFKISTLVAGLGIGGVALALASQAMLGDMFSYFAIMLDKPFELDDFIIIGADFMGSVEHIGIKTTRIRSLGGEQLVFSNKDLTDSRIRNYKRMDLRRIVFKLGVTYKTSVDQLRSATALIKEIITRMSDTRFDRAHFLSYGDYNLVLEVVYYVLSADYNKYMDIQQEINLSIKEAFEREKIEFSFPTQTIYLDPSQKTTLPLEQVPAG